jgi:hypothetical protein
MFMLKDFHIGELENEEDRRMNAGIHAEFTLRRGRTARQMSSACTQNLKMSGIR